MTVVLGDTATNLHASEHGRLNDDHFSWKTLCYERLRQTVDLTQHWTCNHRTVHHTHTVSQSVDFYAMPGMDTGRVDPRIWSGQNFRQIWRVGSKYLKCCIMWILQFLWCFWSKSWWKKCCISTLVRSGDGSLISSKTWVGSEWVRVCVGRVGPGPKNWTASNSVLCNGIRVRRCNTSWFRLKIHLLGRPYGVTGGLIKCSWCFSFFFTAKSPSPLGRSPRNFATWSELASTL